RNALGQLVSRRPAGGFLPETVEHVGHRGLRDGVPCSRRGRAAMAVVDDYWIATVTPLLAAYPQTFVPSPTKACMRTVADGVPAGTVNGRTKPPDPGAPPTPPVGNEGATASTGVTSRKQEPAAGIEAGDTPSRKRAVLWGAVSGGS